MQDPIIYTRSENLSSYLPTTYFWKLLTEAIAIFFFKDRSLFPFSLSAYGTCLLLPFCDSKVSFPKLVEENSMSSWSPWNDNSSAMLLARWGDSSRKSHYPLTVIAIPFQLNGISAVSLTDYKPANICTILHSFSSRWLSLWALWALPR